MSERIDESFESSPQIEEACHQRIHALKQMLADEVRTKEALQLECNQRIQELQRLHRSELEQILQTFVGDEALRTILGRESKPLIAHHELELWVAELKQQIQIPTPVVIKSDPQLKFAKKELQRYQKLVDRIRKEVNGWNDRPWFKRAFRSLNLKSLKNFKPL